MIQAHGRTDSIIHIADSSTVHICVQNVRCGKQKPVIAHQLIEQLKLPPDDSAQRINQQNNERRLYPRQSNIADLLEDGCTVHLCRLIILLADSRDSRQIHHRAIPQTFPDIEKDNDKRPPGGIGIKIHRLSLKDIDNDIVNQPVVIIEQIVGKYVQDHIGDEMGHQNQGLIHLFEPLPGELADDDSHRDLTEISQDNKCQIVEYGILRQPPQGPGDEKELKIFQPHKRTAQ